MTATQVSRNFSAVLNRVSAGEEIEVTRDGAAVAVLSPPRKYFLSAAEFRELMKSLPPIDEDFARDVMEARRSLRPPESHWPS
jgi:prevent-host-death family protein